MDYELTTELIGLGKMNQDRFGQILFHLIKAVVHVDLARKKKLFLTIFAHRKFILWRSCGFTFQTFDLEMAHFELYNLAEDIAEQHNLAESQPGRLDAMKEILAQLHAEIEAEGPKW